MKMRMTKIKMKAKIVIKTVISLMQRIQRILITLRTQSKQQSRMEMIKLRTKLIKIA